MTDTPLEIAHRVADMMGRIPGLAEEMFCGTAQPHSAGYWLGMGRRWHRCPGFVERRAVEPHEHTITLNDHAIGLTLVHLRKVAEHYRLYHYTDDFLAVSKVIRDIERQSAE